jgi:hypothetical protein
VLVNVGIARPLTIAGGSIETDAPPVGAGADGSALTGGVYTGGT